MDRDTDQFPSSPTNSSPSSSDLDTESTGSFFPDRSTTLGTLMGLTFPDPPARPGRPPSGRQPDPSADSGLRKQKPGRRRRRRGGGGGWWRLCRDEVGPTSLEEFLRAERQITVAEGDFIGGGRRLFENGRVLPPAAAAAEGRRRKSGEAMGRLPVLIAGICSGGEW